MHRVGAVPSAEEALDVDGTSQLGLGHLHVHTSRDLLHYHRVASASSQDETYDALRRR